MAEIYQAADGITRCGWTRATPEFVPYHDVEWGYPVADDRLLFEKLCLECFQSGLSWRTILLKREDIRRAFSNFEIATVAAYDEQDIAKLLSNTGIIRNRRKIEAVINNARCALDLISEEGSLSSFIWKFEPATDDNVPPQSVSTSNHSIALAQALKQRGWKFVGPTTAFAFMQAMGLINDHAIGCESRSKVDAVRAAFKRPVR